MKFTTKTKENNNNNTNNSSISKESWGMGFFFIFFPEEDDNNINNNNNNNIHNKKHNFSLSSSSSSYSPSFKSINTILKRSNSSHLISKAQSTISICALLIFITLLLFTLSTFEPTNTIHYHKTKHPLPTRPGSTRPVSSRPVLFPHALQGMGSLYRRGTRAMQDVIVAHVTESVTVKELKYFLRLLHRTGSTCKSDIVFIFSSRTTSFDNVIVAENNSFLKLVKNYSSNFDPASSDPTRFVISGLKEKESGEPIWGRKIRSSNNNTNGNNVTELTRDESTRLSYGSVVGFDVGELDTENSLSGFLEHVPMSLRRWACYPMLLGRVRRNYKHVMLVDVKEFIVLGDSLSQLKNRSPESVILTTIPSKRKNSEKRQINSGIVFGGARGVRRLANAMLTEVVRVIIMQHKKRNLVSESVLFNQLVGNEFILKNVNLIVYGESIHELSSLTGLLNSKSGSNSFNISKFPIIRRGNSNLDVSYVFKKYLCSSSLDSIAYSDC